MLTATEPAPPADTEVDTMVSLESAVTATVWSASTWVAPAMYASVYLTITPTSAPTPTPADPPMATAPATSMTVVSSCAWTATPGSLTFVSSWAITVASLPMYALVVSVNTPTVTEPEMAALPAPAPPTAMPINSSEDSAATESPTSPAVFTLAFGATYASTVSIWTK